jgi:hypothetical protein
LNANSNCFLWWLIQPTKLNEPHSFFLLLFSATAQITRRMMMASCETKKVSRETKERSTSLTVENVDDSSLDWGHWIYSFVSNGNIQNNTTKSRYFCWLLTKVCYVTWIVGVFITICFHRWRLDGTLNWILDR